MKFASHDNVLEGLALKALTIDLSETRGSRAEELLSALHREACEDPSRPASPFIPAPRKLGPGNRRLKDAIDKSAEVFKYQHAQETFFLWTFCDRSAVLMVRPKEGDMNVIPQPLMMPLSYGKKDDKFYIKNIMSSGKQVRAVSFYQRGGNLTSSPLFQKNRDSVGEMKRFRDRFKAALRSNMKKIAKAFEDAPRLIFDLSPDTLSVHADKVVPHYAECHTMSLKDRDRVAALVSDLTDYLRLQHADIDDLRFSLVSRRILASGAVTKMTVQTTSQLPIFSEFPLEALEAWIESILAGKNEILDPKKQIRQLKGSPFAIGPLTYSKDGHISAHRKLEVTVRMNSLFEAHPVRDPDLAARIAA